MTPRSEASRIEDIRLCCERITRDSAGMNQEDLAANDLVSDAVLRNIEIIGEATKHLPEDVRARMRGIAWKKIAGMRNWVSHVDHAVAPDIVWDVISARIPELLKAIERFQDQESV